MNIVIDSHQCPLCPLWGQEEKWTLHGLKIGQAAGLGGPHGWMLPRGVYIVVAPGAIEVASAAKQLNLARQNRHLENDVLEQVQGGWRDVLLPRALGDQLVDKTGLSWPRRPPGPVALSKRCFRRSKSKDTKCATLGL